jgi:hypothetical protein
LAKLILPQNYTIDIYSVLLEILIGKISITKIENVVSLYQHAQLAEV